MQCWLHLDEKANFDSSEIPHISLLRSAKSLSEGINNNDNRRWTFSLIMNHDMLPNEVVFVTGCCPSLGNWMHENSVQMIHKEGTNEWIVTVDIPRDREIQYRFFVGAFVPTTENVIVRRWETHLKPRFIPELNENSESNDIFGDIDGQEKIDRGWLTTETLIQFKFFKYPFIWKQRMKNRLLYVKVTPMNLRIHADAPIAISPLEDSLSNDTRENAVEQPPFAFAEVVTLNYNDSHIKTQPQFGTPCGLDDVILFNITVADPDNIAYLIDLYTYSSKASLDDPPHHFGYHYVLPNVLKKSEGKLEIPITCATKHRPVGIMKIDYLIVKPLPTHNFNMKTSYQRYWNKKWTGLDVGHRGSGTSFKAKDTVIRENTIASLKNAAAHGADMVEFDVQLSKDLVPVIYHDFHVYVSLKSKKMYDVNDLLELPMRELTLEQLKNLMVYHLVEGRSREPRNFHNEDLEEHQPFPQLSDVLDAIDPHVGFNIEIKSSQQLIDGTMESEATFDRNLYVDCILDVVLKKAGSRRIVFSCFDPDTCGMIRNKQNIYPVMFLTLGTTTKYTAYFDPRCNTVEAAVSNARAMELLGIVAHTEDLLRDPNKVNLATNQGLIVFCWGDDNNSKETIKMLKSMGLHAIIYDKMDVLTTKEVKESVFLVQAREIQNEQLFKIQCLEIGRRCPEEQQQSQIIKENQEEVVGLKDETSEKQKMAMTAASSISSILNQFG